MKWGGNIVERFICRQKIEEILWIALCMMAKDNKFSTTKKYRHVLSKNFKKKKKKKIMVSGIN